MYILYINFIYIPLSSNLKQERQLRQVCSAAKDAAFTSAMISFQVPRIVMRCLLRPQKRSTHAEKRLIKGVANKVVQLFECADFLSFHFFS